MRSFVKLLIIGILTNALCMSLLFHPVTVEGFYSPALYSNSLFGGSLFGGSSHYYGYFTGINPMIGGSLLGGYGSSLWGNNFYGSLYSPLGMGPYNPLSQIVQVYDYLNYCLRFYEIARQTPFLYMYDQEADYIGANLYNYAIHLDVSPQEAIFYYIRENILSPQT